MRIRIAVTDLKEAQACQEWVNKFEKEFGDALELDWTIEEQIKWLKTEWRRVLRWACQKKLLPMWSLQRADLQRADLRGANLWGANLWRTVANEKTIWPEGFKIETP